MLEANYLKTLYFTKRIIFLLCLCAAILLLQWLASIGQSNKIDITSAFLVTAFIGLLGLAHDISKTKIFRYLQIGLFSTLFCWLGSSLFFFLEMIVSVPKVDVDSPLKALPSFALIYALVGGYYVSNLHLMDTKAGKYIQRGWEYVSNLKWLNYLLAATVLLGGMAIGGYAFYLNNLN
jgi:hypothetical protein